MLCGRAMPFSPSSSFGSLDSDDYRMMEGLSEYLDHVRHPPSVIHRHRHRHRHVCRGNLTLTCVTFCDCRTSMVISSWSRPDMSLDHPIASMR